MERSFLTPKHVVVDIENEAGSVVLTAVDTASTTVWLEADSPASADLVERATVESWPAGDRDVVRIRIPHPQGMRFVRRGGVTVRVDMPLHGDVDIKTASADVELNGTMGNIAVKSASGDITADDATGHVEVTTASGDLSLENVGGDLRTHSASGDIRVISVDGRATVTGQSGDIEIGSVDRGADIRTASGDIRLGEVAGDTSVGGVSGDVRVLSFALGNLRIRSVSGDVTVGIPHGTQFMVDASSMSGSVSSEIPLESSPAGTAESPAVSVTARSVSGDFLMERAVGSLVA
ncbi:MAG TPA: DUF4097 family beta strand repeat-containing protein [Acidimicrobiales bacterium]|nr:DUF4097 family beta strand repeat-containing protein [Acidimicrobiales bacterium]